MSKQPNEKKQVLPGSKPTTIAASVKKAIQKRRTTETNTNPEPKKQKSTTKDAFINWSKVMISKQWKNIYCINIRLATVDEKTGITTYTLIQNIVDNYNEAQEKTSGANDGDHITVKNSNKGRNEMVKWFTKHQHMTDGTIPLSYQGKVTHPKNGCCPY